MLDCHQVQEVMKQFDGCRMLDAGLEVSTHCLYPSFDPVKVCINSMSGDTFFVHDGAGAERSAWMSGRESGSFAYQARNASRAFGCEYSNGSISCRVDGSDWLWSAIAAVANASSEAARAAVSKVRVASENNIIEDALQLLEIRFDVKPTRNIALQGQSGKMHKFDIGVKRDADTALIDAVTDHPNSISNKFVAFSDTPSGPNIFKYALHDGSLSQEDKVLLAGVADLIAIEAMRKTNGAAIFQ